MVAPKCAGQKITAVRYSSVISEEEYKILRILYTIQNTEKTQYTVTSPSINQSGPPQPAWHQL